MKVSVAMCTYNGAKFVREQLDSIARQSRLPDELIIVDDASSDSTVRILNEFREKSPFPVTIVVNEENSGVNFSFYKSTSLCRGEIVFWSDQDDRWKEDKIRKFIVIFDNNPQIGAITCDANIVDKNLNYLGYSLWSSEGFNKERQVAFNGGACFDILLNRNIAWGMTMAFRSDYIKLIFPVSDKWHHDGWAALLISAVAPVFALREALVDYRQHNRNAVGLQRATLQLKCARYIEQWHGRSSQNRKKYEWVVDRLEPVLARLNAFYPGDQLLESKIKIQGKIEHFQNRAAMRNPGSRRLSMVIKELKSNSYQKHSSGIKSVVEDLFF
jgi:glycosyltransferase involved in cell wall biosynthesis